MKSQKCSLNQLVFKLIGAIKLKWKVRQYKTWITIRIVHDHDALFTGVFHLFIISSILKSHHWICFFLFHRISMQCMLDVKASPWWSSRCGLLLCTVQSWAYATDTTVTTYSINPHRLGVVLRLDQTSSENQSWKGTIWL